jgi:hypothetical protein
VLRTFGYDSALDGSFAQTEPRILTMAERHRTGGKSNRATADMLAT